MMPPHNAGRRWTVLMDAALIGMLIDGVNIDVASERLGRTRLAVIQRIALLADEGFLRFQEGI